MTPRAPVGRVALLLGFAGLLPQVAAMALLASAGDRSLVDTAVHGGVERGAQAYAALILSFLGGTWWGFAMRRDGRQGPLVAAAVVPSLIAFAVLIAGEVAWSDRAVLVALGIAIVLTLPVDRHLVAAGDAPANWMRLRVPLSVGLGALTIMAGVFAS